MTFTQSQIERINALFYSFAIDGGNWKESDHPRKNNGQFGSKGNSSHKSGKVELSKIFDIAIANRSGNKIFSTFGKVSDKAIKIAKETTGLDISDWDNGIDESAVRHTMNQHGNEQKEKERGQRAVTKADFERLPDIVNDFDSMEYSGTNSEGSEAFLIRKVINDEIFCVQEVRKKRKKLSVKTIWIRKNKATT